MKSGILDWLKADGAMHGELYKKKPEIALRLLPLTGGLSFLLYGGSVSFFKQLICQTANLIQGFVITA